MDYGKIIATRKSKVYSGTSNITHKALYRVYYSIYFYKDSEKVIGYLTQDKPFTYSKGFGKKSEANKFLKDNNYIVEQWEEK